MQACLRVLVPLFLLFASFTMNGQLAIPGRPMPDNGQLKAGEVIYLLPPLSDLQTEALLQEAEESDLKLMKYATERGLDLDPANHGAWTNWDTFRVWRVHIISPGAFSLGLELGEYNLRKGVNLFVFNPRRDVVRGAYGSHNNKPYGTLAIGHLPGEELILELQVPLGMEDFGSLRVSSLYHAFKQPGGTKDKRFGRSHDCEIDVACEEGNAWLRQRRAVVRINTGREWCTGVMLNNTDYDGTPYVLTAQHCIPNQDRAEGSEFCFNYDSPSCFGGDGSTTQSISGAELVAVGDSIDFSLVKLSLNPPAHFKPYFAGWDLDAQQSGPSVVIHHPEGDVKKISIDEDDISEPESLSDIPNTDLRDYYYFSFWWVKNWEWGVTEGGSSGSPLFNKRGLVIGTLTGGKATCLDSIDFDAQKKRTIYRKVEDDYFTKLNVAWNYYAPDGPVLKSWLDPGNTGAKAVQGFYPYSNATDKVPGLSALKLYPNPASDFLHIECTPVHGRVRYRILDAQGRAVLSGSWLEMPQPVQTLELSQLSPGIYFLELGWTDGRASGIFTLDR
ncbi:MAG: hypothetical protein CSA96_01265 [Bacteroidetes bacterium]|nr:MAG: hypothetical protein CSA96_01265 [Bacteroidota bacterium]